MIYIILVALIMSVTTAFIAKQKGKNPIAWFFYGLLFGIFALVYIVLYKKELDGDQKYQALMSDTASLKSYYYEIVTNDIDSDWKKLRSLILDTNKDFRLRKNDHGKLLTVENKDKTGIIELKLDQRENETVIIVASVNCGEIDLSDFEDRVAVSKEMTKAEDVQVSKTTIETKTEQPSMNSNASSVADELTKLADLHERGHLTSEEYASQKAKLL